MAKTRRTLLDLYSPGTEVTFDDGEGAVTVWLQKISPAEHEIAVRKASSSRARLRAVLNDRDSDDYLAMVDDISTYAPQILVNYLVSEREIELRMSVEAELELGDDSEWGKDGYARGLVEAWRGGLANRHIEDPDDPEVVRVLNEIKRYGEEVQTRVAPEMEGIRANYTVYPVEKLREEVIDKFIENRLMASWSKEYERCRIWKATRFPENHRENYFKNREEVDHLADQVRDQLIAAYNAMAVDAAEGKGSPETPASSTSSETPDTAEEGDSGHAGASPSKTSPSS